jgi:PPOX class probable FMN-dependent enzyme
MIHRMTRALVEDEAALRELLGEPTPIVRSKLADRLTPATRPFVEKSSFVCLATSDAQGRCDCSPRGDAPGFVRILDDRTLLLPERPGNRLADSLRNIVANPRVGLLFVIPGVGDSFRVNGRACLTTDATLLAPCAVEGKAPKLGILVDVEEAYTQCSKAFLRSHLWDPARFVDRATLPTHGQVLACVRDEPGFDVAGHDAERAARYARREGFY